MSDQKLSAGAVLARLAEVVRQNRAAFATTVAGLTVLNVALDASASGAGATAPASVASFLAQFYLTASVLERIGLRAPAGRKRVGAFLGLSLLSGLGILLGLVLLIVPGVYLAVRWSVASPMLLAEDVGASDALGKSWALTESSFWAILAVQLLIFVPALLIAIGATLLFDAWQPLVASTISYAVLFGAFAASWLSGVAIYALLKPADGHLAEVFA